MSAASPARLTGADKVSYVRGMFDRIAPRYDALNTFISGGNDRRFRRRLVDALGLAPDACVLDVGCGTGALGQAVVERAPAGVRVVGVDLAERMLERGRARHRGAAFVAGDGLRLPLADAAFDAACCAFVFRNVPDIPRLLSEMRRVLKPGGRFAALEIGRGHGRVWGPLYRTWFFRVMPRVAGPLSGDRQAYRYLAETVERAPGPDAITAWMEKAGLARVEATSILGGAVWLYTGRA